MHTHYLISSTRLVVAALSLGLAPVAIAGKPASSAVTPRAPFDMGQLRNYARALVEVERVRDRVHAMDKDLSPDDRRVLTQKSDVTMRAILKQNGFDLDTFNAISKAAESRPELRRQVERALLAQAVGIEPT